ncbi:SAVED domain-containing protein [Serratia marcescens]|uniref:SAVED domain-containing protein n=1 Tax=Serratia marcescens TaxID=615 RepID=UPI003891C3B3
METVKYILIKLIDWKTRQRKIQYLIMLLGAGILGVNNSLGKALTLEKGNARFSLTVSEGNVITDSVVNFVAAFIVLGGFVWLLVDAYREAKITVRKKVVVIEGRALRKVATTPLHKTVSRYFNGKIDALTLDMTQRMKDGAIGHPEEAFDDNISTLASNIATRIDGIDHLDLTLVYGGQLPVPFTFYIGAILDDNGLVCVFDWDRAQEAWRLIDNYADDDGADFTLMEGLVTTAAKDVVLAVSVSYQADIAAIRQTFPAYPLSHISLNATTIGNHWSLSKQTRLALQFIEQVKMLTACGAERIHVILAAPSSIALNFGRRYDHRNLAQLIVYQYEKAQQPAYPWGVVMPTQGQRRGAVIKPPAVPSTD